MNLSPIRLMLIDDHSLFREGLARLLAMEPELEVAGHFATIDEGLAALARETIDIVLLDYDLGTEVGTNFLASIAVLEPRPQILIVTAGMTEKATREALAAGALEVLPKHCGPQQLIDAIRRADAAERVAQVGVPIPENAIIQAEDEAAGPFSDRPLTVRQSTALRGILDGLSNKEIAERMNISESSVKAILQELFRKAGVRTRSQLVRVAIERHADDWIRGGA